MDLATFGLGMQGLGYLTSALGAYGQAKTDRLNFRHQQIMGNWQTRMNNAYNQYQSDRRGRKVSPMSRANTCSAATRPKP